MRLGNAKLPEGYPDWPAAGVDVNWGIFVEWQRETVALVAWTSHVLSQQKAHSLMAESRRRCWQNQRRSRSSAQHAIRVPPQSH
jgi:hypothetical protein